MNKIEVEKYTDENGVLWYVKDLTLEQEEYHNEHMDKDIFKKYSPEMKIIDNRLYTKSFGKHIGEYDFFSEVYEGGIAYAEKAIEELNNNGIYHGDILSGDDGSDIQYKNIVYDGSNYKLIDFGPKTEKLELEPMKDVKVPAGRPTPLEHMTEDKGNILDVEKRLFDYYKLAKGWKRLENEEKRKKKEGRRSKSRKMRTGDSPGSSSDDEAVFFPSINRIHRDDSVVNGNLFDRFGGKKKRRRTKKKRRRKRKYTRRKKKRKRRRTKKKRRRRR